MPFLNPDKRIKWDWNFIQSLENEPHCYQLTEQQAVFLSHVLPHFTWDTRWVNTGDSTQDDRSAFGNEAIFAITQPSDDCGGSGSLGQCYRLDTTSETFKYFPNDPFDASDQANTSIGVRWRRMQYLLDQSVLPGWAQDLVETLGYIGYFPNDVMSAYTDKGLTALKIQWFGILEALYNATVYPFPSVEWQCRGVGQFEIELCQLPGGGGALVTWDIDLTIGQILDIVLGGELDEGDNFRVVELNRDIISVPPELVPTLIQEIEFTEDTEHKVKVHFFPRFNDELPVLFPYFGIREIEICGLEMFGWDTGEYFGQYEAGLDDHIRKGVAPMATVDELCEAFLCSAEELARRILLAQNTGNIVTGVEINKDTGEITLSERDTQPEIEFNADSNELASGGTRFQALKFAKMIADVDDQHTNGFTDSTIATLVGNAIIPIDPITFSAIVTAYTTWIDVPNTAIVVDVDVLAGYFFCEGLSSGFTSYVSDNFTNEDEINFLLDFYKQIPPGTWSKWYEDGSRSPTSDYIDYPCYLRPTQEITRTAAGTNAVVEFPVSGYVNAGVRRLKITAVGGFSKPDGHYMDIAYSRDDNDNVARLDWNQFFLWDEDESATQQSITPPINIAYQANHVYQWFVEIGDDYLTTLRTRTPSSLAWLGDVDVTGEITWTISDAGAVQ